MQPKGSFYSYQLISKLNAMDILQFFAEWIRPTADWLGGVMAGVNRTRIDKRLSIFW